VCIIAHRVPATASRKHLWRIGTELSRVHIYYNNTICVNANAIIIRLVAVRTSSYYIVLYINILLYMHFFGLVLKPVGHSGCAIFSPAANTYYVLSLRICISCVTRTLLSPLDRPRMYIIYKCIILYIVLSPHVGVWFLLCYCF